MLDWLWRRLGIHKHEWVTTFQEASMHVQQCWICGRYRSTMYNMSTGDTVWVWGDHWSHSHGHK